MDVPSPIDCMPRPAMGIPDLAVNSAQLEARKLQHTCSANDESIEETIEGSIAIPLCMFAGGLVAARVIASTSKAFHTAVCKGWWDLKYAFPSRLYVIGGLDGGFRASNTAERYDPLTGSWESLPLLKSARAGSSAVAVAGRLYVIGGEGCGRALNDVQRFDPWFSRWETLPPMRQGRIRAAATHSDACIFVLGGLDGTQPLKCVECFDVQKLEWQEMPSMICPRYAGIASAQGPWILAIGGELTEAGMKASIERYDSKIGVWESLPSVQQPRCGAAMTLASSGQAALTFGGLSLNGQPLSVSKQLPLDDYMTLNPEDDEDPPRWTFLPSMQTARHCASAASYCGGAVAVGGKGSKSEVLSSVEFFNSDNWNWEMLPPLPNPRLRAAVAGGCL